MSVQEPVIYTKMTNLYESLVDELLREGTPLGMLTETFGVHRRIEMPYQYVSESIKTFRDVLPTYQWTHRENMERLHYNKLRYSLSHSFAENWFYKKEWIGETRRVIALSSDCISSISLYLRPDPDRIMMSVYFRSSHLTRLFPVDFSFLINLPQMFMEDLAGTIQTFNIPHELPYVEKIIIDMSFGNLHAHTSELPQPEVKGWK